MMSREKGTKPKGKKEKRQKRRERKGGKERQAKPHAKAKFYPGQTFLNACVSAEIQYKFTNCKNIEKFLSMSKSKFNVFLSGSNAAKYACHEDRPSQTIDCLFNFEQV